MSYNTAVFVEHEIHAHCRFDLLRKEDDGSTTYFDPSHGMKVVERPTGQSVADWYAAHRLTNTTA